MWRLKTSVGGGGPWMQTVSNYHGQQVWEFDPTAGTDEERAHVERLRREFTENRFRRRESQDLMRIQFTGLKNLHADMPTALKLDDEVTEEVLLASLRRSLSWMSALQADDGHWPGDYSGIMYLLPFWIFALHITGSIDDALSTEHKREICRHICNHQNEDGGWSFNILYDNAMFGSCLNYVTLRLLGEVQKDESDGLAQARTWILSHGTAPAAPQWAKILLSVIGVYDWSGNDPVIPELWLLPQFLPIHPVFFQIDGQKSASRCHRGQKCYQDVCNMDSSTSKSPWTPSKTTALELVYMSLFTLQILQASITFLVPVENDISSKVSTFLTPLRPLSK